MNNTAGACISSMYSEPRIISAELIDGRIEIVKRAETLYTYDTYPLQQHFPKIWKEIYAAHQRGEIILEAVINATYIPSQPEGWIFNEVTK